jgi:hypothetical protein
MEFLQNFANEKKKEEEGSKHGRVGRVLDCSHEQMTFESHLEQKETYHRLFTCLYCKRGKLNLYILKAHCLMVLLYMHFVVNGFQQNALWNLTLVNIYIYIYIYIYINKLSRGEICVANFRPPCDIYDRQCSC